MLHCNSTIRPSAHTAPVAVLDPGNYAAGAHTTGWVSMASLGAIMALIQTGTLAAGATVDAKLEQAQDGNGTGVKDIAGKAITQFTQAGADGDKQALINLFTNELDTNGGFTHVRLKVTSAVAAADLSAALLGFYPRYGSADANKATTVDEIVS